MSLEEQANASNNTEGMHRTWLSFNFENSVGLIHEGLPGTPNKYRIRVRMDQSYRLTDLKCTWKPPTGAEGSAKRLLRLQATAKDTIRTVKANKSFEIFVDPACDVDSTSSPSVTHRPDKEECWVEFTVGKLPADLPQAQS